MLQLLFLLLIFLIFFLLLLLVIPYYYSFSFKYQQDFSCSINLSLIFLKLHFSWQGEDQSFVIEIFGFQKNLQLRETKVGSLIEEKSKKVINKKINELGSKSKKKEKSKKKSAFNFDFKLINKENLNHIFRFIVELFKILKMDYLKLYIYFSFADPYYNGLFLAFYYTIKELFDYPDLKAEISWQEVVFEAEGSTGGKIIPAQIIFHLLKFVFSLKTIKILWRLYQSNSKKG